MLSYLAVKHAHVTFAMLSFAGFLLRSWWMWRDSPLLRHRLTRTLPHVNDSLLLAAGVWLALLLHTSPLAAVPGLQRNWPPCCCTSCWAAWP